MSRKIILFRNSMTLKSQLKPKCVFSLYNQKRKLSEINSHVTWFFLLINVLRVRTTPASTFFLHFGFSGRHLIISCLSTLTLGTQSSWWLPAYIPLIAVLVQAELCLKPIGLQYCLLLVRCTKNFHVTLSNLSVILKQDFAGGGQKEVAHKPWNLSVQAQLWSR